MDEFWTQVLDCLARSEENEGFAMPYDQAKALVSQNANDPEVMADTLAASVAPASDDA